MMENPSDRAYRTLCALSGAAGVVMLFASFALNPSPPPASSEELVRWGQQHYAHGLWGAWLQATGPVLIMLFAFALVHIAGAAQRLEGWMTFFGGTVLMTVSLIEITFYLAAWNPDPVIMPLISLKFIAATQHLYFMVAAPALFLPLGIVLIKSGILPRAFGYLAILLAAVFAALGAAFMLRLALPGPVTAFAGLQALWWLAASLALMIRKPDAG